MTKIATKNTKAKKKLVVKDLEGLKAGVVTIHQVAEVSDGTRTLKVDPGKGGLAKQSASSR